MLGVGLNPRNHASIVAIIVEDNLFEIRETHCIKKTVDKTNTFTFRKLHGLTCRWP